MKIAIVQMHYPKGHRRLDQEYVRILSQDNELVIVDDGKYFPNEWCAEMGVERLRVHPIMVKRWERFKRFLHYLNLLYVFMVLKVHRKSYDAILFLNIHCALYFVSKWLPQKKVIIFHHQDIDDMLSYPLYKQQFNKVKNEYIHICLADFITEGLVKETGVDAGKIHTVFQPLVFNTDLVQNNMTKDNLLIGIGNSTDEGVINALIEYDKNHSVGQPHNSIIMRSKTQEFKGNVLTVINGYLPRDEYESLYTRAKASIVMYPKLYKLRYSGIIDDSLAKQLVVYANDNQCARYFSSKYPNNVKIFKSAEELWNMSQMDIPKPDPTEYDLFINNHSDNIIRLQLNKAINS